MSTAWCLAYHIDPSNITAIPQPRQRVAQALWPDSTDGQARTNLRNVVHHLRRTAPRVAGLLRIDPGALCWVGSPHCRVDLVGFQTALDTTRAAAPRSPAQQEALREAVRWHRSDLLADCPDEWLVDERTRLRELLLAALRDLVGLLSTTHAQSTVEAAAYGRELVRRDPLNEAHHRLLVEAYRAAGDRASAIRAYHDCVTLLRQELGVMPSEATHDAYTRLLADTADRMDTTDTNVTAPFVGRARELGELTRRWRDTATGGASLVLVTGEPGIGKTRLVEELAARCARDGALVVSARCYAAEGELGYGPVIEWLRAPELAATLRRSAPADLRYLMRLLPELAPEGVGSTRDGSTPALRRRGAGPDGRRSTLAVGAR